MPDSKEPTIDQWPPTEEVLQAQRQKRQNDHDALMKRATQELSKERNDSLNKIFDCPEQRTASQNNFNKNLSASRKRREYTQKPIKKTEPNVRFREKVPKASFDGKFPMMSKFQYGEMVRGVERGERARNAARRRQDESSAAR